MGKQLALWAGKVSELSSNILEIRKNAFLRSIKARNQNGTNRYKRVALSPIRYPGGKSLAVGYIVELLPTNITRVISPFFGGGSVEIAISKFLGLEVIGYDIFEILMDYWKVQIENPKLLYEKLKELKPNRETFYKIKEILKEHWEGKIKLDPITLAAYFFFNWNLSYGPGFLGWPSSVYLDEKRYQKMIEKVRDFNPGNLKVGCADFRETLKKYPNDFMYLDPPYYIGPDSKMFKGIYPQRNFPIFHNNFPHEILRDMLKKHKGGFILSYNDCPTIRKWYKEYQQFFPKWQYTMGQGETRIGKYRKERGVNTYIKESHEIIIFSPPQE
jgi:DNA adenine methylase